MPHLKESEPPFVSVVRLIKGYGITQTALSEIIQCNPRTAKKKMDNPELLTLGDLKRISQRRHIPIEELRGAVKWQA